MKTPYFLCALGILFLIVSCSQLPSFLDNNREQLTQFGDAIIDFSSEYSEAPGPWSSFVVLGEPDTYPEYGDIQTAWASRYPDEMVELLAISFDTAQYVNNVSIYETFNPGAVSEVSVRNKEDGSWMTVYEGGIELGLKAASRIMEINFTTTSFLVDAVRINISSVLVEGWNEIDAVSISGQFDKN